MNITRDEYRFINIVRTYCTGSQESITNRRVYRMMGCSDCDGQIVLKGLVEKGFIKVTMIAKAYMNLTLTKKALSIATNVYSFKVLFEVNKCGPVQYRKNGGPKFTNMICEHKLQCLLWGWDYMNDKKLIRSIINSFLQAGYIESKYSSGYDITYYAITELGMEKYKEVYPIYSKLDIRCHKWANSK